MTIKELYEWAIKNQVEGFVIEVQCRNGGLIVDGTESDLFLEIDVNEGVVIL